MKTTVIFRLISLIFLLIFTSCIIFTRRDQLAEGEYYVATYVWPSCHDEQRSRELFWSKEIGEWEIIKTGTPRFEGHYQPRVPLWGYTMDDDPIAWEKKINAATSHGINVFIFDWYWYDGKPFLEETLNSGFLKANNNDKMKFYIMWANHDVAGNMWNHNYYKTDSVVLHGEVDWNNFKLIVNRLINKYFNHPNYFKIDGKPVISIFSLSELIQSFEGINGTKSALEYFREEVRKAGFPDLHIQGIGWWKDGNPDFNLGKNGEGKEINEFVSALDLNSVTMYNWSNPGTLEDYIKYAEGAMTLRNKWDSVLHVPFFPCVSVGWDNTPRYPERGKEYVIHLNSTPESFGAYLQKTRDFIREHPEQPRLIIINAWNEWAEGSYLEPDTKWGYSYLETVKKVMSGEYDQYK